MQQDVSGHLIMLSKTKAIFKSQQKEFSESALVERNESELVRPLAYVCAYLSPAEINVLQLQVEDPRCAFLENADRSLAILHACGEGKTKYRALSKPLQQRGCTDFRAAFFHTIDDEEGVGLRQISWSRFRIPERTPTSRQVKGASILQERSTNRSLPTSLPASCTHEVAWAACRIAL